MAVFTFSSATGAPGVTTSAVGLALAWPRSVVLVEADRCASHALLASCVGGVATAGRGLTSLAQAYRDGIDLVDDLPSHMVPFPDSPPDDEVRQWLIPGFARPGSAQLFQPVWPEFSAALSGLDRLGIDVIVDAGRWGSDGLPRDLVANTRCLVLVTRGHLRSLAALRLYLPDVAVAVSGASGCSTGLLVIGANDPYGSDEISEQFGLPVWGELPWQPADAAGLSDGAPVRRKANNRPLARSLQMTAETLRGLAQRWDQQVGRGVAQPTEAMSHV